jgi:hypothetical protein
MVSSCEHSTEHSCLIRQRTWPADVTISFLTRPLSHQTNSLVGITLSHNCHLNTQLKKACIYLPVPIFRVRKCLHYDMKIYWITGSMRNFVQSRFSQKRINLNAPYTPQSRKFSMVRGIYLAALYCFRCDNELRVTWHKQIWHVCQDTFT